ncbi:MAG: response regulator [Chloroflexota bacterium]
MAGPDRTRSAPSSPGPDVSRATCPADAGLRILVVDNEVRFTAMLRSLLEVDGHRVVAAFDPREAIAVVERESLDVAIVDLSMPVMNGWKLAEQLRRRQPGLAIVLCTGWGDYTTDADQRAQVDVILAKPFRLNDLRRAIVDARSRAGWQSAPTALDRD